MSSPEASASPRSPAEVARLAVVALGAATALAAQLLPALASRLEYDRARLAAEPWRWLTGHLAHASWDHLGLDLAVFVALGLAARPGAVLRTLALSALAVPAAIRLFLPALDAYRGLSGLDAALVALLAAEAIRDRLAGRAGAGLALAAVATLGGLLAKTAWELATGTALFVDSAGADFVPVPLAHAVGGLSGVVVAALASSARGGQPGDPASAGERLRPHTAGSPATGASASSRLSLRRETASRG